MEQAQHLKPEPREFTRQDILDALVHAAGIEEGGELNMHGRDYSIARGLNERGFRVLPPIHIPDCIIPHPYGEISE